MPAYITVNFTIKDKEKLQQYGAAAAVTLKKYAGEYLAKGASTQLHGDCGFQTQVILVFPSREQALAWYQSKDYQALVALRDTAMDSQFQLIWSQFD